jgi:transposase
MKVSLWAEIRRLHEIEKLTGRAIANRLRCSTRTVAKAIASFRPPLGTAQPRRFGVEPYCGRIDALVAKYPQLSAVRILEEISRPPDGFQGSVYQVRRYLQRTRPSRGRVYQEVVYEPGEAMQVDWGDCGRVTIGRTVRRVSVFVAVLCYSRMIYIEFTLSQRKAEFYRALVHALEFFQGSTRKIIVDNLRSAVLSGSGRHARFHPEFLALCGTYCMEPIACEARDPESKGTVEGSVRYVKRNALAGRGDLLTRWEDYRLLAASWRDEVANVRLHATTGERPIDRFRKERLRPLPAIPFDTDEILSAEVTSHVRVRYDGNRYSTPTSLANKTVLLRIDADVLRIEYQGREVARHARCYEKGQLLVHDDHRLAALSQRRRRRADQREAEFDALGPIARTFRLKLLTLPVQPTVHLRRLLGLVRLYGSQSVLAAMAQALEYQTYDSAYVEVLVLQERRRRELPSPTPLRPQRKELIDDIHLEEPDPARYDRFLGSSDSPESIP